MSDNQESSAAEGQVPRASSAGGATDPKTQGQAQQDHENDQDLFRPAEDDDGHDRLHTLAAHVVDAVEHGHFRHGEQQGHGAASGEGDQEPADYHRRTRQAQRDQQASAAEEEGDGEYQPERTEGDDDHRTSAAEDLLSFATEQAMPADYAGVGVDSNGNYQFNTLLDQAQNAEAEGGAAGASAALQEAMDAESAARAALANGGFDSADVVDALQHAHHAHHAGHRTQPDGTVVDENGNVVFAGGSYDEEVAAAAAAEAHALAEQHGEHAGHEEDPEHQTLEHHTDLSQSMLSKSGRKRKRKGPMAPETVQAKKETHKEVERRRRQVISEGIEQIAAVLPNAEKQKGQILQAAASYLKNLIETNRTMQEEYETERNTLREQYSQLEVHYADLQQTLTQHQDHYANVETAWAKDREELEKLRTELEKVRAERAE